MNEGFNNKFERSPIPKEREVLKLIEGEIGEKSYSEIRREEDGEGLYRLIVEVIGDDGDPIHYDYVRAGEFPGGKISETAIDVIYLDNEGSEVGGSKLASYKGGEWIIG